MCKIEVHTMQCSITETDHVKIKQVLDRDVRIMSESVGDLTNDFIIVIRGYKKHNSDTYCVDTEYNRLFEKGKMNE